MKSYVFVLIAIFLVTMLSACAGIKSVQNPSNDELANGITYFMPKKDFMVTIEVKGGKIDIDKIKLETTPSYPDLSKQYVLTDKKNLFAQSDFNFSLTRSGLLTSGKSHIRSDFPLIFAELAQMAGGIGGANGKIFIQTQPAKLECKDGTHTFIYKTSGDYSACGMKIKIEKNAETINIVPSPYIDNKGHAGIYYRQDIPYLMTAKGNGLNTAAIIFSPSESPTHFLPISEVLFSKNDADIALQDGVLIGFKQAREGEALALVKLPASIINAYFSAIGSIFDKIGKNNTSEKTAIQNLIDLELAKKKYNDCINAIKTNDKALIELNCK